jgi:ribosomal protein L11 methyltransferase
MFSVADPSADYHWIEVSLKSNGEIAEALADVLGRFVTDGIVIANIMQFNPETHEHEPTSEVKVTGYLPFDETLDKKRQSLEEALWHLSQIAEIPQPTYKPIKKQDWMASWKKHYHPIPVGKKLLIMPAWFQPEANETRLLIKINPAMAFGTGTHPTTQICLILLENHFNPGTLAMDIGCGSGILSIAALRLGAEKILAVDVDEEAIQATRENLALNQMTESHLLSGKGSVEEIRTGRFGFQKAPCVMVNIIAPIILHLFSQGLAHLVSENGLLLLSGILDHQQEEILQRASCNGFQPIEKLQIDDWVGFTMKKSIKNAS